jgi:hypothetical protein
MVFDHKTKLDIIKQLETKTDSQRGIAKKFKVSKTSIQYLWANRNKILKENNLHNILKLKDERIEKGTLEIIRKMRDENVPLTGPLIKSVAKKISVSIGLNFSASNGFLFLLNCSKGWLQKFKKRNEMDFKTLCGESKSADIPAAKNFKQKLIEIKKKYPEKDIFNADETALFWKAFQKKSFVFKDDSLKVYFISIYFLRALKLTKEELQ